MLNIDTHILIDFLRGELSEKEKEKVFSDEIAISDIVLWELSKLVQLKRIQLELNDSDLKKFLKSITILPITFEIARASCKLDFKSDPADEIIAATSLVHKIPLLTRDKKIRKSKLIKTAA